MGFRGLESRCGSGLFFLRFQERICFQFFLGLEVVVFFGSWFQFLFLESVVRYFFFDFEFLFFVAQFFFFRFFDDIFVKIVVVGNIRSRFWWGDIVIGSIRSYRQSLEFVFISRFWLLRDSFYIGLKKKFWELGMFFLGV